MSVAFAVALLAVALAAAPELVDAVCGAQSGWSEECPAGQCCSQYGFCGNSAGHCDVAQGCQDSCWAPSQCGDGSCTGSETCGSCPWDCGPCQHRGIVHECLNELDYALTFDDGPTGVTDGLLDILADEGVIASFFVIGQQIPGRESTIQRIHDDGHFIASHTQDHPDLTTLEQSAIRDQLRLADEALQGAICEGTRIMRPPYGAITEEGIVTVENMGYMIVNWNLDTFDWQHAVSDPGEMYEIVDTLTDELHPGSIIHLQHDRVQESVDTVRTIIDIIRSKGYNFVRVDECVYGHDYDPVPASLAFTRQSCPENPPGGPQGPNADCIYSAWSDWSPCPTECGDFEHSRARFVVAQEKGFGEACDWDSLVEVEQCGTACGCGDGVCAADEDCGTCVLDCGPCQAPGIVTECVTPGEYALTFDDGPTSSITTALLDILADEGVTASFFVIGVNIEGRESTLQRQLAEGHSIASHTHTHPNLAELSAAEVRDEMNNAMAAIESAVCVRPKLMRPPLGSTGPASLAELEALGYRVVTWNLDTLDWQDAATNPSAVVDRAKDIMDDTYPGSIIHLQHDVLAASVGTVRDIIDYARGKGYTFVSLNQCVYGASAMDNDASVVWSQQECPRDPQPANSNCVLSDWSEWSQCPQECGTGFERVRVRVVKDPATGTGTCSEAALDTDECPNYCVCGNDACDTGEDCAGCPEDCGPCQSSGMTYGCLNQNDYALTFDNGPTDLTSDLLTILDDEGAKATFFVAGNEVPGREAGLAAISDAGHYIATNGGGYTDLNEFVSEDEIRAHLSAGEDAVASASCWRPRVFRPPFGSVSDEALEVVAAAGYRAVGWNLDARDWQYADTIPSEIVWRVRNGIDDIAPLGIIHLQQFHHAGSVGVVRDIITWVRNKGYRLVTMDECLYGVHAARNPSVVYSQRHCLSSSPETSSSDCVLSDWSSWEGCPDECGVAGTEKRIRYVITEAGVLGDCDFNGEQGEPEVESRACDNPCPFCGDRACGPGESCKDCPVDCGPCQPSGVVTTCVDPLDYALTFDDGPSSVTDGLLDILAAKEVTATFFVVANLIQDRLPTFQRAYNEGHSIASHTYAHPDLALLPLAQVQQQIELADNAIADAICYRPRMVRPPYGSLTHEGFVLIESMGFRVVNWNVDTFDWLHANEDPNEILRRVDALTNDTYPDSIIHLQHDLLQASVDTVPAVIDIVRSKGYNIVDLDTCLYGPAPRTPVPAPLAFAQQDCAADPPAGNVDCTVSEWGEWAGCPAICGQGQRKRSRLVVTPEAGLGTCDDDLEEAEPCPESHKCTCGDSHCTAGETCRNCPDDCGPCQAAGVVQKCVNDGEMLLAFDGGPTPATDHLLVHLDMYNVTAAFFVSANRLNGWRVDLLNRIVAAGHYVGSAGFKPDQLLHLDTPQIVESMVQADELIHASICQRPRVMRAPAGTLNYVDTAAIEAMGYLVVSWNVDTLDGQHAATAPNTVLQQTQDEIERALPGGAIHLQHDTTRDSIDLVPTIIEVAQNEGYTLVGLEQCLYGDNWRDSPSLYFASTAACDELAPVDPAPGVCDFTDWSQWSPCEACAQSRVRYDRSGNGGIGCVAGGGNEPLVQSRTCRVPECGNFDCTVGEWSEWTPCPSACENVTSTRQRTVEQFAVGSGSCVPLLEMNECPRCYCTQGVQTSAGVSAQQAIVVLEDGDEPLTVGTAFTYEVWLSCHPPHEIDVVVLAAGQGGDLFSTLADDNLLVRVINGTGPAQGTFTTDAWSQDAAVTVSVSALSNPFNQGNKTFSVVHSLVDVELGVVIGTLTVPVIFVDDDYDPDAPNFDATPVAVVKSSATVLVDSGASHNVRLDGSDSSDSRDDDLTFQWTYVQVPPGLALDDMAFAGDGDTAVTEALAIAVPGTYVARLQVSDPQFQFDVEYGRVSAVGIVDAPTLAAGSAVCAVRGRCTIEYSWAGAPPASTSTTTLWLVADGVKVATLSTVEAEHGADTGYAFTGGLPSSSLPASSAGSVQRFSFAYDVPVGLPPGSGYEFEVVVDVVVSTAEVLAADGYDLLPGANPAMTLRLSATGAAFGVPVAYEYSTGDWGACSVTCGLGAQSRDVFCVAAASSALASDLECASAGLARPAASRDCDAGPCVGVVGGVGWRVGQWSECEATCGPAAAAAVSTRTVECYDTSSAQVVINWHCRQQNSWAGPEPARERPCGAAGSVCEAFAWALTPWSQCSSSCGNSGVRRRSLECRGGLGTLASAAHCADDSGVLAGGAQPVLQEGCNRVSCGAYFATVGHWGECSLPCGGGTSTLDVTCISTSTGVAAPLEACAAAGALPAVIERDCNVRACDALYYAVGPWSPCLASNPGTRQCVNGGRDGYQTRSVRCAAESGAAVAASACADAGLMDVPALSQKCTVTGGVACDFCFDNRCSGHGACAEGNCTCARGFDGRYCHVSEACTGVLMGDGSCCEGVLMPGGACCTGGPGSADIVRLDRHGTCCPSGILDACGVCEGSGRHVDVTGVCCAGELDAGGLCCDEAAAGGTGVDECGVCGGVSACPFLMDAELADPDGATGTGPGDVSLASPTAAFAAYITALRLTFAHGFQVSLDRIVLQRLWRTSRMRLRQLDSPEVHAMTHTHGERVLQGSSVMVTVAVLPPPSATAGAGPNIVDPVAAEARILAGGPSAPVAVLSLSPLARSGVCGNGVCEVGERCAPSDGGAGCCALDCGFASVASCPGGDGSGGGGSACSGHGACVGGVGGVGACDCWLGTGYAGHDCSACAPGFANVGGGQCAVVPYVAAAPRAPAPPPTLLIADGDEPEVSILDEADWLVYVLWGCGALLLCAMLGFIVNACRIYTLLGFRARSMQHIDVNKEAAQEEDLCCKYLCCCCMYGRVEAMPGSPMRGRAGAGARLDGTGDVWNAVNQRDEGRAGQDDEVSRALRAVAALDATGGSSDTARTGNPTIKGHLSAFSAAAAGDDDSPSVVVRIRSRPATTTGAGMGARALSGDMGPMTPSHPHHANESPFGSVSAPGSRATSAQRARRFGDSGDEDGKTGGRTTMAALLARDKADDDPPAVSPAASGAPTPSDILSSLGKLIDSGGLEDAAHRIGGGGGGGDEGRGLLMESLGDFDIEAGTDEPVGAGAGGGDGSRATSRRGSDAGSTDRDSVMSASRSHNTKHKKHKKHKKKHKKHKKDRDRDDDASVSGADN